MNRSICQLALFSFILTAIACTGRQYVLEDDICANNYSPCYDLFYGNIELIKQELSALPFDHPYVGIYGACGFEHSCVIALTLNGQYYLLHDSDWTEVLHGTYTYNKGVIHLSHVLSDTYYLSDDLYLITWGRRKYLIPVNSYADFLDSVAIGKEPRYDPCGAWLLLSYSHSCPTRLSPDPPISRIH